MLEAPPPRRRRRRLVRGALLLLLLLLLVGGVVVVPRWRGLNLWLELTSTDTPDAGARTIFAVPLQEPGADAPWAPEAWIVHFPRPLGAEGALPGLLFAHGLTAQGLGDERIQRAVHAFGRAGFLVLAPEVASLRWPGHRAPDVEALARAWRRLVEPSDAPAESDPMRAGGVGVSLGGALLLRGIARAVREGAKPPRSLLLLGVPWDLKPLVERWSGPPAAEATPAEVSDHVFARQAVLQAAAAVVFADRPAVHEIVQAWLAGAQIPVGAPPTEDAEALEFAAFATNPSADGTWHARVREAAWQRLEPLSLAQHADELAVLHEVPVFLVHGRGDRLVPIAHMHALAQSFPRAHTLASSLLGHADIGSASLGERWNHVVDVDDFLDEVDP